MAKKQTLVYLGIKISRAQRRWLKAKAKSRNQTVAAMVRTMIDDARGVAPPPISNAQTDGENNE